jgi:hypothetical protein
MQSTSGYAPVQNNVKSPICRCARRWPRVLRPRPSISVTAMKVAPEPSAQVTCHPAFEPPPPAQRVIDQRRIGHTESTLEGVLRETGKNRRITDVGRLVHELVPSAPRAARGGPSKQSPHGRHGKPKTNSRPPLKLEPGRPTHLKHDASYHLILSAIQTEVKFLAPPMYPLLLSAATPIVS